MQICDSNILLKDQDAVFMALVNLESLIDLFEELPTISAVIDRCADSLDEEGFVFLRSDLEAVVRDELEFHRNSRRKPPNSFGWRNAALIHTRKRPCARDAHFATLC